MDATLPGAAGCCVDSADARVLHLPHRPLLPTAALLHDIGDVLAPHTHGEMVAAILKPYLNEEICWVIKYHGLFQMFYYAHHRDQDRNERDQYRDHPYYHACVEFCEKYDQNCFDPAYDSLPVTFFEPMVRRIFAHPHYLE